MYFFNQIRLSVTFNFLELFYTCEIWNSPIYIDGPIINSLNLIFQI